MGHVDNRNAGEVTEISFSMPVTIEGVHIVPADMSPPGLSVEGVVGVTTPKINEGVFDVEFAIHTLPDYGTIKTVALLPKVSGGVMWHPFNAVDAATPTNQLIIRGTFQRMTLILHGTVLNVSSLPLEVQDNFTRGTITSPLENGCKFALDGSDWDYLSPVPPPKEGGDPSGRDWARARAIRRIPAALGMSLMPPPFIAQLGNVNVGSASNNGARDNMINGHDKHKRGQEDDEWADKAGKANKSIPASARGMVTRTRTRTRTRTLTRTRT